NFVRNTCRRSRGSGLTGITLTTVFGIFLAEVSQDKPHSTMGFLVYKEFHFLPFLQFILLDLLKKLPITAFYRAVIPGFQKIDAGQGAVCIFQMSLCLQFPDSLFQ